METAECELQNGNAAGLDAALNLLVEVVDGEEFPSSWPVDTSWSIDVPLEGEAGVVACKAFRNERSQEAEAQWNTILTKFVDPESPWRLRGSKEQRRRLRNELEFLVIELRIASEMLPFALGYAAGLRTAGASKEWTCSTLRSFFRNFLDSGSSK